MKRSRIYFALLYLFITFNFVGEIMATEEPRFTLESKNDRYEIRKYESYLVAETVIKSNFEDSGNSAFRILADYIFGNNHSKIKLEMTAPVTLQKNSETISMTSPVTQSKTNDGFLVQFVLPNSLTMETVPEPNDPRVKIRQVQGRKIAVISYSGSWSEELYKTKLSELLNDIARDGIQAKGEPVFSRFNSPFQLWFLRRNEIWIDIDQK